MRFNFCQKLAALAREILPFLAKRFHVPTYGFDLYSASYRAGLARGLSALQAILEKKRLVPASLTCLDVGVGKGWSSAMYADWGMRVFGVDLAGTVGEQLALTQIAWQKDLWEMLAASRPGLAFAFFDGETLPSESSTYNLVSAIAVLEHVDQATEKNDLRLRWLDELHRVLKPGGFVFIAACPNACSYAEGLAKKLNLPKHRKLFYRAELENLLRSAGFTILRWGWSHPFIDFFPQSMLQNIWNMSYLFFWRWLEPIFLLPPFRSWAHHFFCIVEKKPTEL
jgi:SAM-dependent methyltransferase